MPNQKSFSTASGLVLTIALVVSWLLALHAASIYSFTTGFFLTRYEVKNFSDSDPVPVPGSFSKAVIIVIDALRFDFALHNFSLSEPYSMPYTNKLPSIFETLRDERQNSYLFRFVADPPTTTMQRLKGLTTGGMPTFIDAIDNFNSDAIREDTWVRQISRAGKKVIFMGDDTWTSLFPDTFARSYPFPSFDVKDLHTVDNGVIANLVPEIKNRNGDWDVIIGHFLGVDHVGHRLGSEHPEMAYKLMQMDRVLRDVKESIDEDTILMVFGDHGMTADGNHGGSTDLEVDSALFVYSKRPINKGKFASTTPSVEDIQSVYQIDLVPTICSLLGAPMPFGNLGFVIPELLSNIDRSQLENADLIDLQRLAKSASANADQVMRYLRTYSSITRQFPADDLRKVEELYSNAAQMLKTQSESKEQIVRVIESLRNFHDVAIATCRKLWTTFDTVAMWIGIFGGFGAAGSALVAALSTLDQLSSRYLAFLTVLGGVVGSVLGGIILGFSSTALPSLLGLASIGSAFFFSIVSGLLKPVILGALELLFPSHFVESNDSATAAAEGRTSPPRRARASSTEAGDFAPYMSPVGEYGWLYGLVALTCLFMRCAGLWSNSYIEAEEHVSAFLLATLSATFGVSSFGGQATRQMIQRTVILYMVLKLASFVTAGKHESFLSASGISSAISILLQTFAPMMALPSAALSLSEIYESYASKSAPKRSSYWIRMWLHTCVALVLTFWTAQWFGLLESFWMFRILLPQFVFIGTVVALILRFVYQSSQRTDFVFGWIAAVSFPALALILGPPSPASLLLLFVAAHCVLDLSSEIERKSASSKSAFGFALAVFWHLLSTRWFYATGHQQQFNALQFSAPFVGFDKFNLVIGAIIMIVNTFASQMLCGFFVPFLAFWEGRPTLISGKKAGAAKIPQQIRHEEVLRRVPRPLETLARRTLFYVFIASFLFLNTLGLTYMMRRHLMVWRVFAPKFVFEAGALLVTDVAVLLGMVVTWRHTP